MTALSEMRDTMGLILQSYGHDPSNFTDAQFDDAINKIKKAVDSGQIRRFTGNDYAPELAKGDIAACIALVRRRHPARRWRTPRSSSSRRTRA